MLLCVVTGEFDGMARLTPNLCRDAPDARGESQK